ncbi:hypothetical protein BD779DRAFT_1468743 [Infundibulicybe gibba]|nr:hypothetical protein BD779DRAFT_1468743 [Infundibulicybe gibba]
MQRIRLDTLAAWRSEWLKSLGRLGQLRCGKCGRYYRDGQNQHFEPARYIQRWQDRHADSDRSPSKYMNPEQSNAPSHMNMSQRGVSFPWPPRRSTAGGIKADTAPVTAQYGGPLRNPANGGHVMHGTPCRGELHIAFCPSLATAPGGTIKAGGWNGGISIALVNGRDYEHTGIRGGTDLAGPAEPYVNCQWGKRD